MAIVTHSLQKICIKRIQQQKTRWSQSRTTVANFDQTKSSCKNGSRLFRRALIDLAKWLAWDKMNYMIDQYNNRIYCIAMSIRMSCVELKLKILYAHWKWGSTHGCTLSESNNIKKKIDHTHTSPRRDSTERKKGPKYLFSEGESCTTKWMPSPFGYGCCMAFRASSFSQG